MYKRLCAVLVAFILLFVTGSVRAQNGTNQPPTISTIADQTIDRNSVTAAIPFTLGDDITSAENLSVVASSGNYVVVRNSDITLGGSGANRTVTVKAVPNQSGTAAIILTVSDGTLSTYKYFFLTVTGQNDPPTISTIADQKISVNGSTGALAFTVGDDLTEPGMLALSASSSNGTVVPSENIKLGGSETNRTVTVTPAANQVGTATITLNVGDGTQATSTRFILTVAANQAPTISTIADQTIDPNGVTATLPFTIGDDLTPPENLSVVASSGNYTVVRNSDITLGGSGANRTVTVKAAPNQSGVAGIVLTVSDGTLSTYKYFFLTVTGRNDPPTISPIADQKIVMNGSTGPLAFTISDDLTEVGMLALSYSCNNTALVPLENIVFGGSDANRTITVTSAADKTGTATIQVNFGDGTQATSMRFVVTVVTNQPPTISDMPDQTVDPNGMTGVIPFTIGDDLTPAENLIVTSSYTNYNVVRGSDIVLGGSGANRTVTVKALSTPGVAAIILTVSDGTLSTYKYFYLTVAGRNDPPTISPIADQKIAMNSSTGALAFTIGDDLTEPGMLSLSYSCYNTALVPLENIKFGGSDANRTVTVTPAANKTGTATIQVNFGDGSQATSMRFVVTVFAAPAITGFSPSSGPVGTSVVITGANFTGTTAVAFNGRNATFTVNSATQISALVPGPATTGTVSVTTPGGTATSATVFMVTPGGDSTPPGIAITTPPDGQVLR